MRSYLAAQVSRGTTMIAWVWDVYDRDQQRALRLSGEEPAGKAGRDAWAAADDLVLRKIAQAGFSGLTGMINGTRRPMRRRRPRPARPGGGQLPEADAGSPASALGYASDQPRSATPPSYAKSSARLAIFARKT